MNITCPNCGATSSLENGASTCECIYCGTKLSLDSLSSAHSVSKERMISSYIELAESAYRGKDYKGLKKYADLALEQDVHNSKLWWYKALAEAKLIINESKRISWIVECGEKAIQYAEDKDRAAADIDLVYIELAIDKLNFISQWSTTDLFEEPDSTVVEYENDIIALARIVPKEAIKNEPDVKNKMLELSQCWLRHMNIHVGTVKRARFLKDIYMEISPLPEAEKKKELELFGIDFIKSQHDSNELDRKSCIGCVVITVAIVFVVLLTWVFH